MTQIDNLRHACDKICVSVFIPDWQTPRMAKVKVAVLGTGSLGQHNARIYSELHAAGSVELTGIFDAHAETARKIAEKHQLRVFNSIAEAAAASDALNIATPTTTHFDIAKQLLESQDAAE